MGTHYIINNCVSVCVCVPMTVVLFSFVPPLKCISVIVGNNIHIGAVLLHCCGSTAVNEERTNGASERPTKRTKTAYTQNVFPLIFY